MSNTVDAAQAWVNEYASRQGDAPGVNELKSELDRSVEMCRQLLDERENLQARLQQLQAERDMYLDAVYALTHKEFDFDKDELLAQCANQQPLAEFLAELEADSGNP
jgi:hypothetical protein